MKYIIMCGGSQIGFKIPRHLTKINGEPLVLRTARLLKENGVDYNDIEIMTDKFIFDDLGIKVRRVFYDNCLWLSAFAWIYFEEPTCYIFGDVVFSPKAIKTIVETETDDIELFASAPPFNQGIYQKRWAEPFAFKVVDQMHFARALKETQELFLKYKAFRRSPIAWELWQVIKKTPLNIIDYTNYTVINDYTCDIDSPKDVEWWNSRRGIFLKD